MSLLASMDIGVILGLVAALGGLCVIRRRAGQVEGWSRAGPPWEQNNADAALVPPGVEIYTVGSLFELDGLRRAQTVLAQVAEPPAVLIVCLERVVVLDTRGIHTLREVIRRSQAEGTVILFCGVKSQARAVLARSGLVDELGAHNLLPNLPRALEMAARRTAPHP